MLPSLTSILSRLRLKHMQLLVAIEDHGSLHKAARAISISQPGATKVLQEIEVSIGMLLFERTSKGIVANEAGRCVTRYSRLICNDIAHMREEITGLIEG
ncbi:LysR family transcriptional regulator, partial [Zobellella denitrificans]